MSPVHRPLSILPVEGQVLFLCAGGIQNDAPLAGLLALPIAWDQLLWLAELEKAIPVLPRRLARVAQHALPDDGKRLEQLAAVWEFRLSHLQQRVKESLAVLRKEGVVPVLLKGAALAATVYPSFVARPMVDIDLLVTREEADHARQVLLANGWRWRKDSMPEDRYKEHHHLPPIEDAMGTGVDLELHTALFIKGHPFGLTGELMRAEAREGTLDGEPCLVPTLHHQLMHASLHFAWSNEMRVGAFRTFRDVDTVAATGRVDWPGFVRQAQEWRAATCCYWTFRLARAMVGISIPEFVLAALKPSLPESLLRRLEAHYVLQLLPPGDACPSERLAQALWALGVQPGRSGHGSVRPWERDVSGTPQAHLTVGERSARQLKNLRGWWSYSRSLLSA